MKQKMERRRVFFGIFAVVIRMIAVFVEGRHLTQTSNAVGFDYENSEDDSPKNNEAKTNTTRINCLILRSNGSKDESKTIEKHDAGHKLLVIIKTPHSQDHEFQKELTTATVTVGQELIIKLQLESHTAVETPIAVANDWDGDGNLQTEKKNGGIHRNKKETDVEGIAPKIFNPASILLIAIASVAVLAMVITCLRVMVKCGNLKRTMALKCIQEAIASKKSDQDLQDEDMNVMAEEYIAALTSVKDKLADKWDIDAVLDTLIARKVITLHDKECVEVEKINRDKVNVFLRLFIKKDNSAFGEFLSILLDKDQHHIIDLIIKGIKSNLKPITLTLEKIQVITQYTKVRVSSIQRDIFLPNMIAAFAAAVIILCFLFLVMLNMNSQHMPPTKVSTQQDDHVLLSIANYVIYVADHGAMVACIIGVTATVFVISSSKSLSVSNEDSMLTINTISITISLPPLVEIESDIADLSQSGYQSHLSHQTESFKDKSGENDQRSEKKQETFKNNQILDPRDKEPLESSQMNQDDCKLLQSSGQKTTDPEVTFNSIMDAITYFEKIAASKKELLKNFESHFRTLLVNNIPLQAELLKVGALPYWEKQEFNQKWDLETVSYVSCKLKMFVMSEGVGALSQDQYLEVGNIHEIPIVSEMELRHIFQKIYHFMLQRIKMWGCHFLYPGQIDELIKPLEKAKGNRGKRKTVQEIVRFPASRLDFISLVLSSTDCLVASDIIRVISMFSMAMPLVVNDLQNGRQLFILPLYRGVTLRWEGNSGTIIENQLFQSPFKLIISIRRGCNDTRPGKSSILNQLMKKPHLFASRGEPGGIYGKPCTLEGSVEFVWLTQETCSATLWTRVLNPHYLTGKNELILLANVHGDINDHPSIFKLFESFSPSWLLFEMPLTTKDRGGPTELIKRYSRNRKLHQIFVDSDVSPTEMKNDEEADDKDEDFEDQYELQTANLADDKNLRDLHDAIKKAVSSASLNSETDINKLSKEIGAAPCRQRYGARLECSDYIYSKLSEAVIEMMNEKKCDGTKQCMQRKRIKHMTEQESILNASWLDSLMDKFILIFDQSLLEVRKAIAHLEIELSHLSRIQSSRAREAVSMLKTEQQKLFGSESKTTVELKVHAEKINGALKDIDNINFGLEHFFREMAERYRMNLVSSNPNQALTNLPSHCADLLLNGIAIELLNGDEATIAVEWISAICKYVDRKHPNFKVFVVSILGIQSSGKSTLLNALFSCKFAVSIGRCSRGLFMRLVFLNESLRNKCGFDAFLLLDTEGLGSPEKMHDKSADEKDRSMATLAMGVSNLSIINIMGDNMVQITEIMQIAILAMARLEKTDMASDMILVQHLPVKDSKQLLEARQNFCKALEVAFNLVNENQTHLGILDVACLSNLIKRIQEGNFFKEFSPLREGSTVHAAPSEAYHKDVINLYETIIAVSQELQTKRTLLSWSQIVGSYWQLTKSENFACQFKSAQKMIEFIERDKRLSSIRTAVESTFRHHMTIIENQMRQEINAGMQDMSKFLSELDGKLAQFPMACSSGSATTADNKACVNCQEAIDLINLMYKDVKRTDHESDTRHIIETHTKRISENAHKILSQMFGALVFNSKFSDKYSEVINRELMIIVQNNNTGKFTDAERNHVVQKIWKKLKDEASKEPVPDKINVRIEQEISMEYNMLNFIQMFQSKVTRDDFKLAKAIDRKENYRLLSAVTSVIRGETILSKQEVQKLLMKLDDALFNSLQKYAALKHFEAGMIRELKTQIDNEILAFESECKKKLITSYIWMAHAYVLQQFAEEMIIKEKEWDKQHNPCLILEQKWPEYEKTINTRLQLGFDAAAEGNIVAMQTLLAMKQIAKKYVEEKLVKLVEMPWTKSTESFRLFYFDSLVKKILTGDKEAAIAYFENPGVEIRNWFKDKLDSYDRNYAKLQYEKKFEESKKSFLNLVNIDSSMKEVHKWIMYYTSKSDVKCSLKEYNDDDSNLFKKSLLQCIEASPIQNNQEEIDFIPPSNHPSVMDMIGCTEYCYFCHALCWLSRNHEVDDKSSGRNKHLSCHQPSGFGAVHDSKSKELSADSCYQYGDTDFITINEDKMPYHRAKKLFPTWSFNKYSLEEFEQLMRWFFMQLHKEIAARYSLKEARDEDLKKYNCTGLNIETILFSVRSKYY